jgi:hypothetical protein
MFTHEGLQPSVGYAEEKIEERPRDYYAVNGVAGDISTPSPVEVFGQNAKKALNGLVNVLLGPTEEGSTIITPAIWEYDGDGNLVPVEEGMKQLGDKPIDESETAPYEHDEFGARQMISNFAISDKQRPASNDKLGPIAAALFEKNGIAPVAKIAEAAKLDEDFVRNTHIKGVFEVFPDQTTGELMIKSDPAKGFKIVKQDGWDVMVPTESAAAD